MPLLVQAWQQAVSEALEARQRSSGRPGSTTGAAAAPAATSTSGGAASGKPAMQLSAHAGCTPAASTEVLFGAQQHPRAQPLLLALQRGTSGGPSAAAAAAAVLSPPGSFGSSAAAAASASHQPTPPSRSSQRVAQLQQQHEGGGAAAQGSSPLPSLVPPGPPRPGPPAARGGGAGAAGSVPAWPEYLQGCLATAADVRSVEARDVLGWLRSLARGNLPVSDPDACLFGSVVASPSLAAA